MSDKIGAGHASAMWRQGIAEVRAVPYADSNVAQQPGQGIVGVLTPGEISATRYPAPEPEFELD